MRTSNQVLAFDVQVVNRVPYNLFKHLVATELVWAGEFGRTPAVEGDAKKPGFFISNETV